MPITLETKGVHNINTKQTAVYQDFYVHGLNGEEYPVRIQAYIRGTVPVPAGKYTLGEKSLKLAYTRDRLEIDFSNLERLLPPKA